MFFSRRRRLLVDMKLQGRLMFHMAVYWFYCLLSVTCVGFCWIIVSEHPRSSGELFRILWKELGPAIIGSVALLPLVLTDFLRVSNRFCGPMVRLHRELKKLSAGEQAVEVHLRTGDFWCEFASDFNRLVPRLNAASRATSPPPSLDASPLPSPECRELEPANTAAPFSGPVVLSLGETSLPANSEVLI